MFNPKLQAKKAMLFAKRRGTAIQLDWDEWPSGVVPTIDDTSGQVSVPEGVEPIHRTLTIKALVHTVTPTVIRERQFVEIQQGDCIVDVAIPWVRVVVAGDTDFEVGDVMEEFAFKAANRNLADDDMPADSEPLTFADLKNPIVTIDGKKWKGKNRVSEELKSTWDVKIQGYTLIQTFVVEPI